MIEKKPIKIIFILLFLFLSIFVLIKSIWEVGETNYVYFDILLFLLLAFVAEMGVLKFRQSSIMILIFLGMLISPNLLIYLFEFLRSFGNQIALPLDNIHLIEYEGLAGIFSQIGAVILLFKIGLDNRIENIFTKENIIISSLGVIVPFFAGLVYALTTGGSFIYSMFIGTALTATSIAVTGAILKEANLIQGKLAKVIIGAALIDDILGLFVLSFVLNISQTTPAIFSILFMFLGAVIFIVGSVLFGEYFIRYLDRKEVITPVRFLLVLLIIFAYAYIAEFIGVSAIIGAFMAGVVLNKSRHIKTIVERTYVFDYFFLPLFFLSFGIRADLVSIIHNIWPVLTLTIIAILSKLISCTFGSLIAKLNMKEALIVGVGMTPRGVIALVVASIGLTTHSLTVTEYSTISAMALLTTIFVPPFLLHMMKAK